MIFLRTLTMEENGINIFSQGCYRGTRTPLFDAQESVCHHFKHKDPLWRQRCCRAPAASSVLWWGRKALGAGTDVPVWTGQEGLKSQLQHVAGGGIADSRAAPWWQFLEVPPTRCCDHHLSGEGSKAGVRVPAHCWNFWNLELCVCVFVFSIC